MEGYRSNEAANVSTSSLDGDYWLDACEDISQYMIFDPADASADMINPAEQPPDATFFTDMDLIFESLTNGIAVEDAVCEARRLDSSNSKGSCETVEELTPAKCPIEDEKDCRSITVDKHLDPVAKDRKRSTRDPSRSIGSDERYSKRLRFDEDRKFMELRHNSHLSDNPSSKRLRCADEIAGRSNKRVRIHDQNGRRARSFRGYGETERRSPAKDWPEKERKGFWERDHYGKAVYRSVEWEESCKELKRLKQDDERINDGLKRRMEEHKVKLAVEQARKYQLDVLEQAKKQNTIAFLETGAGKTLIAVLLMQSISKEMDQKGQKMLALFLVPKVPLVYQQAEVIREKTGYNVGHYCGEMGHDFWNARKWQHEFDSKKVLVMTAQILLNILRHSIIKMEAIDLLILDECHHAVKKHPYSLVMSEFYHMTPKEKRPTVFGMTASPVNLKGVSSHEDCAIKLRNLESKLDSVLCTIKNRVELEKHVPMPLEIVVQYDKAASLWSLHEQVKQIEKSVEQAARASAKRSKWQLMGARDAGCREELRLVYGVSDRTEADGAANLIQKLRAVDYALSELGQWCAYMVAKSFLAVLENDERASSQIDAKFQKLYLKKVVMLLSCQLSEGAATDKGSNITKAQEDGVIDQETEEGELSDSHVVSGGEHVDKIMGAAVADGKVTPKVQALIKLLLKYQRTEDFRAIVFVERVVTALVLPKVFSNLPSLNFIKCASLIGHNNSQEMRTGAMQDIVAKFREGQITLLVATSVAEEGLDIRQCNLVIRFDLAKTVLAYIQSRGRARKPGSDYVLMLERGNLSHENFLKNARTSEETMRKEAIERTDLTHLDTSKLIIEEGIHGSFYKVESTGAVVSLNSAVGLVHFYCSQLPSDRYSMLRPEFIMVRHEKTGGCVEYSCKLQLPCNAPFENLDGPVCSSMHLAQQAVCLSACKKLHEMGAFTDMLLPDKGSGKEEETIDLDDGDSLPGTARHREFYPEGVAEVLRGEWISNVNSDFSMDSNIIRLYMYYVKLENIGTSSDLFLTQVSEFSVLFGSELDAEVLSTSLDLFLARTMIVKACLVFHGPVDISQSKLVKLKDFHVRLMSIVLDVDAEPSTTPWDTTKAYLFVPTVNDQSLHPTRVIDWYLIERIIFTDAWSNPIQKARPDVFLGTDERSLGGDRREYGFRKLRQGTTLVQNSHPTYGIRGAVAQFDVVKASGLAFSNRHTARYDHEQNVRFGKLVLADCCLHVEELIDRIVTTAHSGKRFYVDSVCYDMDADNSFPRKEGYLGPLEYSSYADYYKQKYGISLMFRKQPLIRVRGVSCCKNLLSPRFSSLEDDGNKMDNNCDKTYFIYLPPELCFVHPLPGPLVRGAQRLPSIMKRIESMLLAIQLKSVIDYPIPAPKILEALTAASCQETYCYERAELLGDAYLKWVVSKYLFLKYPQKHEGQLTRMRQKVVSNMALYQYAIAKGLPAYIQADRFSPSRWAAPGVLPMFDEDTNEDSDSLFGSETTYADCRLLQENHDIYEDSDVEDGEIEADSSGYRVLSTKTLADVVEALIGVYYVEGGKIAANHLMKWIGIQVELESKEVELNTNISFNIPDSVMQNINFDALEAAVNFKFERRGFLVEAITHASRPSAGVSCYQRLEFMGDAVLDHLITRHLFFTYTDLPPGRLTDLRAAAVNNENFARLAVKHRLHVHLRHGSSALEIQIREFVKNVKEELLKPNFNTFGLLDCKAPKVLGDIVESIAGAVFLDSGLNTAVVWRVFKPLLDPMVTPETLPMHPVRELQERCQQQAEGLEYKATRAGNLATVEVFVDGVQIGAAQNPQKKMAQKLAARNALLALKEREKKPEVRSADKGKRNGTQIFTRQALNDMCLRKQWPMPQYRCVHEGGPAHAKRFTYSVRVNTTDRGWTDECIGEPMPNVKKAKDSAALLLFDLFRHWYIHI